MVWTRSLEDHFSSSLCRDGLATKMPERTGPCKVEFEGDGLGAI